MNDIAIEIDELHFASVALRREQSKARKSSFRITCAQANTKALQFNLFNSGHNSSAVRSSLYFVQIVYKTIIIQFLHEAQIRILLGFGGACLGFPLTQLQE
jgi:hypothetical protein